MQKESRIYLKILIVTQVFLALLLVIFAFLSYKGITKHNGELLNMAVIDDNVKTMKSNVNSVINYIDRAYQDAQRQVILMQDYVKVLFEHAHDFDEMKEEIKLYLLQNEYGNIVTIYVKDMEGKYKNIFDEEDVMSAQDLSKGKVIQNKMGSYILYVNEQKLILKVQGKVETSIHEAEYINNSYVWINEVVDYDGGKDYAIRRIHPNLTETEGTYLSTDLQDVNGNLPYLKELEGINQNGDVLHSYYFKNLQDDRVTQKISYAKLYKPFNWIVATGTPLEDMLAYTDQLREYDQSVILTTVLALLFAMSIVFIISLTYIIKRHKKFVGNVKKHIEIETQYDVLTGAFQRKAGEKYLEHIFKSNAECENLFIMLDVDDFKKVNDTYGHDVGDIVLKRISETIMANIRKEDCFVRWGGEEFLLICRNFESTYESMFAEKLLNSVRSLRFVSETYDFYVSVSMGGYTTKSGDKDDQMDYVIKKADEMLYKAKNTGKNQYCSAHKKVE